MAETEYPLLVFAEPTTAERAKRTGGGGKITIPSAGHQAERLAPQFTRLDRAMTERRLALQANPLGIQPEQVLVLETIGSIDNFITAVRHIKGLEWLGDFEHDDLFPEHGFEDEANPQKRLRGQLFLVMTDQRALHEMQRLFCRWRADSSARFPHGLANLKRAFAHLYTIRPWGIEDRIRETGLLQDWNERLQFGSEVVPFEAELWFRRDPRRRRKAELYLRSIVEASGGQIVSQCIIPDIDYHAILGRLPSNQVAEVIDQSSIPKI